MTGQVLVHPPIPMHPPPNLLTLCLGSCVSPGVGPPLPPLGVFASRITTLTTAAASSNCTHPIFTITSQLAPTSSKMAAPLYIGPLLCPRSRPLPCHWVKVPASQTLFAAYCPAHSTGLQAPLPTNHCNTSQPPPQVRWQPLVEASFWGGHGYNLHTTAIQSHFNSVRSSTIEDALYLTQSGKSTDETHNSRGKTTP